VQVHAFRDQQHEVSHGQLPEWEPPGVQLSKPAADKRDEAIRVDGASQIKRFHCIILMFCLCSAYTEWQVSTQLLTPCLDQDSGKRVT